MATEEQITRQYVYEDPAIAAYKLGLYQDAQNYMKQMTDAGVLPPTQAVAGMTADQLAAGNILRSGIGGYEPYLQGALQATQAGQAAITGGALPAIQEAMQGQRLGMSTLRDAQSLAAATRGQPYQARDAAMAGLQGAEQLGRRAASDAQARLGQGAEQARALAGDVGIGALGTAQALGGQLGAATRGGLRASQRGQRGLQAAQEQLAGASAQFDPSAAQGGIASFMDPYTQQVIDAEQAEIARLGEKQKQQARGQQIKAGAFGGSRGAIQEAEIGRNVLEQQARTGAQLRSQGYQQAAQQAQQAFEQSKGRQLQGAGMSGQLAGQGAQLGMSAQQQAAANARALAQSGLAAQQLRGQTGLQAGAMGQQAALQGGQLGLSAAQMAQRGAQAGGQLGLQYGQLGQADVAQLAAMAGQQGQMAQGIGALAGQAGQLGGRLGALGQVQAGLGQQAQQQRAFDASQLMGYGGTQQQQAQNVLNAQFAAEQAAYQQPFQQLGFMADLTKALPSSQSAIFQQSSPSPGFGQQVAGLAMGAAGLARAF